MRRIHEHGFIMPAHAAELGNGSRTHETWPVIGRRRMVSRDDILVQKWNPNRPQHGPSVTSK